MTGKNSVVSNLYGLLPGILKEVAAANDEFEASRSELEGVRFHAGG